MTAKKTPPKCSCDKPDVVYGEVRGKSFWFCRNCRQEVPEKIKFEGFEWWDGD